MARGGFDAEAAPKLQTRPRRILAYCGRKMVLTMGSTSGFRFLQGVREGDEGLAQLVAFYGLRLPFNEVVFRGADHQALKELLFVGRHRVL